ncbi:hypothetical protein KCP75_24730 [Salmonella enterica subsp. enterica]|nr:hypothetical protein KCP75_24730 [Salmonella enterica subsp. enterica]
MSDARDWPDPDAMIAELKSLGIELMVPSGRRWITVPESYRDARKRLVGNKRNALRRSIWDFSAIPPYFDADSSGRDYAFGAKPNATITIKA